MSEPLRARIQDLIASNRVVLFMKGTTQMPQCGFSARTVQALQILDVDFVGVDVLSDPEIRQGIKEFSEWPTIPQLYIDKEFVGGSDIVTQMMTSGELHGLLDIPYETPTPPTLHLSDEFLAAIRSASDNGGATQGHPRIQATDSWEYGIGFSARGPGDLEVEVGGVTFLVDPGSAKRLDGIRIDFKPGPEGGVIIDNPNEPATVRRIAPATLQELLAEKQVLHVFDVRTQKEWDTCRIEGATLLDDAGRDALEQLHPEAVIVLYCHHGMRSMQAAGQLLEKGFRNVFNLEGGIDAWSTQVDSSVPRY